MTTIVEHEQDRDADGVVESDLEGTGDAADVSDSGSGGGLSAVAYAWIATALAAFGIVWVGGRSELADNLLTFAVLGSLLLAVVRRPEVRSVLDKAPVTARRGAALVLALFLFGQVWFVSEDTYPVVSWPMYSYDPGPDATVYTFEAVDATGRSVDFAPTSANPTVPAKMGLVHLRNLSRNLAYWTQEGDVEAAAEAEARLRRIIATYVELHNERSDGPEPVRVEIAQVVYDVTADDLSIDAGERTVLLQIDIEGES